jgi:hypothetical protein
MKPKPTAFPPMLALLALLALLAMLTGGCQSNYGPASPDYYPQFYPPYFTLDPAPAGDLQQKPAAPSMPSFNGAANDNFRPDDQ